ncbi:MAG: undecaprenyldiphospho-muramoylpentapeptide beta-N-acetylglucosaminyltransferase [Oscillospiraceae bacterium]|nr:undecaprenyldiphospho-muramoylpentapeptide beta-N-acetylglucosaminyltransferase [Oscillospiraceae bacterium]
MRAVIAAGGTAGHVNPALAIADEIVRMEPGSEIRFMGREDGMENRLVTSRGYELVPIDVWGFMRSFKWEDILFNLNSLRLIVKSSIEARRFLKNFRPDIVIGCGGYVSGPVVMQASRLGIKTAIHEQNSFPGVTTRILSKRVDLILAPNEDAKNKIGKPGKTVIVGNPVSSKIISADREEARERLGIGDRTCILSFGGSLGAKVINDLVARMFKLCKGRDDIFFIHATGGYDTETFPAELQEEGVSLDDLPCRVSTYIDDMPDCLAASDLVVSRSGAITISELAVSGRASYLIPSPHVAENHQYYNALTLSSRGAAVLEEEKDMVPDRTAEEIIALAEDKDRLAEMARAAKEIAAPDSAREIYIHIKNLLKG